MKKMIFLLLIFIAAIGFAQPTGSVTSDSTWDVDAETLKEALSATITLGALSTSLGITIANIGQDAEIDLTGDIAYAFTDALKVKLASSYGVDSVDKIPVTLTVDWSVWQLAFTASYKNDNLNAAGTDGDLPVETGAISLKAVLSF